MTLLNNRPGAGPVATAAVGRSLAEITLFDGVPPVVLDELARRCRWVHVPQGSALSNGFAAGDVVLVISGRLRLVNAATGTLDFGGEVGPGETFGEIEAIDGGSVLANPVALTEAVLAICPRAVFIELLRTHNVVALRLLARLARRIRQGAMAPAPGDAPATGDAGSGAQRVCGELLRLANPDPSGDGSWVISPTPLHRELADWTGTNVETVGQTIAELMRQGVVRRRNSQLQIIDRGRIEAMVQQGM